MKPLNLFLIVLYPNEMSDSRRPRCHGPIDDVTRRNESFSLSSIKNLTKCLINMACYATNMFRMRFESIFISHVGAKLFFDEKFQLNHLRNHLPISDGDD